MLGLFLLLFFAPGDGLLLAVFPLLVLAPCPPAGLSLISDECQRVWGTDVGEVELYEVEGSAFAQVAENSAWRSLKPPCVVL